MKKGTSFYIFIAILGITFSSCNFTLKESNLDRAPDIHTSEDQANDLVNVIIPIKNQKTKYINVYRRDVDDGTVVNLGILYHPVAIDTPNNNYRFVDRLVKENHTYDYYVRYCIDDKYYKTDYSKEIKITSNIQSYDEATKFAYTTNNADLEIDNPSGVYTLTITGTIVEPDFPEFTTEGYKHALIVKSETATQTLLLPNITNGTTVTLTEFLPSIFLDTDITIEGIVGQKIIYDDPSSANKKIKEIIWTEPASISVNGNIGDSINIPSKTGIDGHDYSRNVKISQ